MPPRPSRFPFKGNQQGSETSPFTFRTDVTKTDFIATHANLAAFVFHSDRASCCSVSMQIC